MSFELRILVIAVLGTDPALRIDFTAGTIQVNRVGLARVRDALMAGRIDVVIGNTGGGEAGYRRDTNTFHLPRAGYGWTADEMSTLVHESVHALGDIEAAFWRTYVESEAAAYVAETLFYRYATNHTIPQDFPDTPPQYVFANTIVDGIINKAGAVVNSRDLQALEQIIVSRPAYQARHITMTSPTGDDGVP